MGKSPRGEAFFLLLGFVIYLRFLFKKRKTEGSHSLKAQKSPFYHALWILGLGFALLFAGSSLAVDSSLNIVKALGLSERFAGIFILSLSTSLPELAVSLQAGLKKEGEMALGNIVGSNLFNTLFALGSAGLIRASFFFQRALL